jgi:hypothetical protein
VPREGTVNEEPDRRSPAPSVPREATDRPLNLIETLVEGANPEPDMLTTELATPIVGLRTIEGEVTVKVSEAELEPSVIATVLSPDTADEGTVYVTENEPELFVEVTPFNVSRPPANVALIGVLAANP